MLGGYKGFEGEPGTSALNEVELITLKETDKFSHNSYWCQRNLSSSEESFDGATIDLIDAFQYIEALEGDSSFSSAHNSFIFERVLICGGADSVYMITN